MSARYAHGAGGLIGSTPGILAAALSFIAIVSDIPLSAGAQPIQPLPAVGGIPAPASNLPVLGNTQNADGAAQQLSPYAPPEHSTYLPFSWPTLRTSLKDSDEKDVQERALANQSAALAFERYKFDEALKARQRAEARQHLWGFVGSATWPLLILIIVGMFRSTINTLALTRKWTLTLPGGSLAVTDQLSQLPGASTRSDALTAAAIIQKAATAQSFPTSAIPPTTVAHAMARSSGDAKLRASALLLDNYFKRASNAITATQLTLLRAAYGGIISYADAGGLFRVAQMRGYPLVRSAWLAFLFGFDFLRDEGVLRRRYAITDLGKQFVQWCDSANINENTLLAQGRGT